MTARTASFAAVLLLLLFSSIADCVNSLGNKVDHVSSSTSSIPVIDIQSWTQPERHSDAERLAIAHAVDQACRGIGFFAIQNHGVDPRVVDHAWNAMQAFFDLPLEIKLQSKTDNDKDYPYGYENGSEKLQVGKNAGQYDATPPDLKETFSIGPYNPESGQQPPRFPAQPVDFESALSAYYRALETLALLLLHIFAVALNLQPNPESWFENKMNRHISALRILNYPPITTAMDPENSILLPDQLRASAHTDYGVFTILKSGGPGLQVKKDVVEDGQQHHDWIDVPNLNDTFVINIGDLMQRWTNDVWISTLHRVIIPPVGDEEEQHCGGGRRNSIAYFVNINGDCLVDPTDIRPDEIPKYAPITAEVHLMTKYLKSMGIEPDFSSESSASKDDRSSSNQDEL